MWWVLVFRKVKKTKKIWIIFKNRRKYINSINKESFLGKDLKDTTLLTRARGGYASGPKVYWHFYFIFTWNKRTIEPVRFKIINVDLTGSRCPECLEYLLPWSLEISKLNFTCVLKGLETRKYRRRLTIPRQTTGETWNIHILVFIHWLFCLLRKRQVNSSFPMHIHWIYRSCNFSIHHWERYL